jgi:hypothetical protein
MIVGLKSKEQSLLGWKLARQIAPKISKSDNHGIGYMALTRQGQMFSERWLDNGKFNQRPCKSDERKLDKLKGMANRRSNNYSVVGTVNHTDTAVIALHTRFATCGRGITNTHPFIHRGVGLIHNGMIHNHEQYTKNVSNCDSEAVLTRYLDEGVKRTPGKIKEAVAPLKGYFACGIMTGKYIDVFKSHSARLHVAYSSDLDAYIYSTCEDSLIKAAKETDIDLSDVYEVNSLIMTRHKPDGTIMSQHDFEEPTSSVTETTSPLMDSWRQRNQYTNYSKSNIGTPVDREMFLNSPSDPWDSDTELLRTLANG